MNFNTCCVCEKNLGNTYSLKIVKEYKTSHTCSYNCNQKVCEIMLNKHYLSFNDYLLHPKIRQWKNIKECQDIKIMHTFVSQLLDLFA